MSLINYASFLDNDDSEQDYISHKKKNNPSNKTQKKQLSPHVDRNKINTVLANIHNQPEDIDPVSEHMSNFSPPPLYNSVNSEKRKERDNNKYTPPNVTPYYEEPQDDQPQKIKGDSFPTTGKDPTPMYSSESVQLNNYTENYRGMASTPAYQFNNGIRMHQYNNNYTPTQAPEDVLMNKINYMISLLEEQQVEKTNNVTEEVVLYSFLGIFVIFLADTFTRVGKYTR